ncbi:MAG: hypothetical protein V7640_2162 [Betaproteobacteria bacterium]
MLKRLGRHLDEHKGIVEWSVGQVSVQWVAYSVRDWFCSRLMLLPRE